MVSEFRLAKGWRIFVYAVCPPLILVFIACACIPFTAEKFSLLAAVLVTPVCALMIGLFGYAMIDAAKGKVIVGKDHFAQLKPFRSRHEISFKQIKGYRVDDKNLHIIPKGDTAKEIAISAYTEQYYVLLEWVKTNFANLDSQDATMEELEVLNSDEFGINKQSRERLLKEARRVCLILNVVGGICFVWGFYPIFYAEGVWTCILTPLISIIVVYYYRGMVRVDQKKRAASHTWHMDCYSPPSLLGCGPLSILNYLSTTICGFR